MLLRMLFMLNHRNTTDSDFGQQSLRSEAVI